MKNCYVKICVFIRRTIYLKRILFFAENDQSSLEISMLLVQKVFKCSDFAFNHFIQSIFTPGGSEKPYKIGLNLIPKNFLFGL